jgi:hypothetical protein
MKYWGGYFQRYVVILCRVSNRGGGGRGTNPPWLEQSHHFAQQIFEIVIFTRRKSHPEK